MTIHSSEQEDHSSEILIARARHLDPDALAQIHEQFFPEIYRYVHFRLEDEMIVEDVASEVFLRLIDALKRKRGPDKNLRGWLYGTASHLVIDHIRRKYRRDEQDMDDLVEHIPSDAFLPEDELERMMVQKDVRRALRKLTPDQQHVIALRFSAEYSLEKTAKMMGKKVNAIKALQFRALASLRRNLVDG